MFLPICEATQGRADFLTEAALLKSCCSCRVQTPKSVNTHFKENLQKLKS